MRKAILFVSLALGCVNSGDNTVPDAGADVTTNDVAADVPIPTGAKLTLGASSIWVAQNGQTQWDPLESTCRHASLSIL